MNGEPAWRVPSIGGDFSLRLSLLALAAGAILLCAGVPASSGTLSEYRHLALDGHLVKWGEPTLGAGAAISYAVVAKETHFADARNCGGIAPLDGLLRANRIARSLFDSELAAAFRGWASVANVAFRRADPASADILIGAETEPRGFAFTNVEYDRKAPGTGPRRIERSLICLNPEKAWKVGFDGNLDVYDLRYTLLHEIGHAIGLDHPTIQGQLMNFKYLERFRAPQMGDVAGVVGLYGPNHAIAAKTIVTIAKAALAAEPADEGESLAIGVPARPVGR
jgi:hypothetical protein